MEKGLQPISIVAHTPRYTCSSVVWNFCCLLEWEPDCKNWKCMRNWTWPASILICVHSDASRVTALETISYREAAIIVYAADFAIVREGGILVLCRYEHNMFPGELSQKWCKWRHYIIDVYLVKNLDLLPLIHPLAVGVSLSGFKGGIWQSKGRGGS